jgi:hypothetical protein
MLVRQLPLSSGVSRYPKPVIALGDGLSRRLKGEKRDAKIGFMARRSLDFRILIAIAPCPCFTGLRKSGSEKLRTCKLKKYARKWMGWGMVVAKRRFR